ncbi:AraC family transcriptional regulator [Acetobacterium carbinolicum]|uniref:AraC family transcriptional regulator n=1 Tax=Acetobacterium carbinolicum TaxID=52690 RepID=UPI0039C9E6D2
MPEEQILYKSNEYIATSIFSVIRYPLHLHTDTVEIILVLKGSLYVKQINEIHRVEKGNFIFINQNDLHCFWSNDGPCIIQLVYLNLKKLIPIYKELKNIKFRNIPFEKQKSFYKEHHYTRGKTFIRYLAEIFNELNVPESSANGMSDILNQFVAWTISEYNYVYFAGGSSEYISSDKMERFYRTVNYVEEFFKEKIAMEDVACHENVSKTYLIQMWKELTNLPLGKYVSLIRVSFSEKLLLFSDKKIYEISEECGFSDIKYYYKNFHTWFGQKPLDWKSRWLTYQSSKMEYHELDTAVGKEYIDQYLRTYLSDIKLNSRIYEQYFLLKELELRSDDKNTMAVVFDLFSQENLTDNNEKLPEWSAIDLFIDKVTELELDLIITIRMDAMRYELYSDNFKMFIEKSIQYYGLRHIKNWEYQFICRSSDQLSDSRIYTEYLLARLNGGKVKSLLT